MASQIHTSIILISHTILVLLITSCSSQILSSEPNYFYYTDNSTDGPYLSVGACGNTTGNYTKNSVYEANLLNLFSNLTSEEPASRSFYNASSGSGSSQVYGLFNCKPGLQPEACLSCVREAKDQLLEMCSTKEAIVYFGDCFLRYSDRQFFSTAAFVPRLSQCDAWDPAIPDPENLTRLIETTMEPLITQVAEANSSGRFAVEAPEIYVDQKVYMLAQCTPDVSKSGCKNCLMLAVDDLTFCSKDGNMWANASRPSCQMRYGFRPFFDLSLLGPTSAQPPQQQLTVPPPALNTSPHPSGAENSRRLGNLAFINVATIILINKFIRP